MVVDFPSHPASYERKTLALIFFEARTVIFLYPLAPRTDQFPC